MGPTFNKLGVLAVGDEADNDGEVTAVDAKVAIAATVEMAELTGVEDVEERNRRSTSLFTFCWLSNASNARKSRTAS